MFPSCSLVRLALAVSLWSFCWPVMAWAQPFQPGTQIEGVEIAGDRFENGVPVHSDGINNFWTLSLPSGASVGETAGKLEIVSGGIGTANGTIGTYLLSGPATPAINFFKESLRFSATVSVGGTAPPGQSVIRFSLTGSSTNSYLADDALVLVIRADNYFALGYKQDRPLQPAETTKSLVTGTVAGPITGFELTLDRQTYALTIRHSGTLGTSSHSGTHGILYSQWGVDGNSTFLLETVRSTGAAAGAGQTTVATLDDFSVRKVWDEALFSDTFSNGQPTNSDAETGIWTGTYSAAGSISETNGRLVQAATAADTSTVLVSSRTPVSGRFNFFDSQLRIRASHVIASQTYAGYMRQGRIVISSAFEDGIASPDVLSVGYRGYNDVTFSGKVDAPRVYPDNAGNPAVKFLIGSRSDPFITFMGESDVPNATDLVLNAERFRLTVFNAGMGSGIARFSGTHGLQKSQWGAKGDSAILLETLRTGAAAANTVATTSWDDLRVESDNSRMLDEPTWDFTPVNALGTSLGKCRVWIPATAPVIRGVIFIGPGSGGDYRHMVHDPIAQEAARSLGFALIGYYQVSLWNNNASQIQASVGAMLAGAASVTGRPEIVNAPFCFTGNSAGAYDSTYVARGWPERMIAFVAHRGGTSGTLTARAKKVPGLFMAGGIDPNGSTNPYLLKNVFNAWRSAGGQVAFCVSWGVGHTPRGNQSWESTWTWLVEVTNLRYPPNMVPSKIPGNAPVLTDIADTDGWLGDTASFSAATTPSVTSPFTPIAPFATYSGTASLASWLPNETCARMYRAVNSTDLVSRSITPLHGPLRLVSPRQFADPVPLGAAVTLEVDPREFDNASPIVAMTFLDGATVLGTDTTGPDWGLTYTPSTIGLHTITVVASNGSGTTRDALRCFFVVPENFPPFGSDQEITMEANTETGGTLSGSDPEGRGLTFALQQAPTRGTLTFDPVSAAFTYRPAWNFSGSDSAIFQSSDGEIQGAPVRVTFHVGAIADGDGDGMADLWESLHGVDVPEADGDGDGSSNLEEYLASTDPGDIGDVLRNLPPTIPAGSTSVLIRWAAKGGVRYRVQYSFDLQGFVDVVRPAGMEMCPMSFGTDGVESFLDDGSLIPPSPTGRTFYRVRVAK